MVWRSCQPPWKEGLDGWPVTGLWYPVVSTLATWAPPIPRIGLDVSSAPNIVERALLVVGENLEKPSAWVTVRVMGWIFQLYEVRQRQCFVTQ